MANKKKEKTVYDTIISMAKDVANNKIEYDVLKEYVKEHVKIKKYLDLVDKNIIIQRTLVAIYGIATDDVLPADLSCNLEMRYCFDVLFRYTDIEVDSKNILVDSYDIIMKSGLYDIIVDVCKNDYNKLIEMINNAISFKNILDFKTSLDSLDMKEMSNNVSKIQDFFNDSANMKNVVDILAFNDPMIKDIKNAIVKNDNV